MSEADANSKGEVKTTTGSSDSVSDHPTAASQREYFTRVQGLAQGGPPVGDADLLAVLEPATSAQVGEKLFLKTTGDSGELAPNDATMPSDPFEVLAEFQTLDEETSDKLEELADDYKALLDRFEAELLPLVDRMQEFLSTHGTMHIPGLPEWVPWRDAFLKRLKIKMSVRTLQRKLKQYRDEEDAGEKAQKAAKRKVERVPVFEESHASQICREAAHLARLVKTLPVSPETEPLIKIADTYLEKLHGDADEVPHPLTGDEEPIPLPELADKLLFVADELACAWGLEGFAREIETIAERVQDRDVLNERMLVLEKRFDKSPNHAVSARYLFKSLRRDRRFQEDMRLIVAAGGTTYRGQTILGGDDPYIWRFSRAEIKAELKGDLWNQLGNQLCLDKEEAEEQHNIAPALAPLTTVPTNVTQDANKTLLNVAFAAANRSGKFREREGHQGAVPSRAEVLHSP